MAGLFMGVSCFADDVILIAPSYQAMQIMLEEAETIAEELKELVDSLVI